jgi:hypothetical protein
MFQPIVARNSIVGGNRSSRSPKTQALLFAQRFSMLGNKEYPFLLLFQTAGNTRLTIPPLNTMQSTNATALQHPKQALAGPGITPAGE